MISDRSKITNEQRTSCVYLPYLFEVYRCFLLLVSSQLAKCAFANIYVNKIGIQSQLEDILSVILLAGIGCWVVCFLIYIQYLQFRYYFKCKFMAVLSWPRSQLYDHNTVYVKIQTQLLFSPTGNFFPHSSTSAEGKIQRFNQQLV